MRTNSAVILLTSTTTVPGYGKLADLFGRKPVFLFGTALGGLIVDHFSWRWVFYINIPFGLLSALLLIIFFKEHVERKKRSLDYSGTLTLTGGIVALLFALLRGGTTWAWNSPPSVAVLGASLAALGVCLVTLFNAHTGLPFVLIDG